MSVHAYFQRKCLSESFRMERYHHIKSFSNMSFFWNDIPGGIQFILWQINIDSLYILIGLHVYCARNLESKWMQRTCFLNCLLISYFQELLNFNRKKLFLHCLNTLIIFIYRLSSNFICIFLQQKYTVYYFI